MNTDLTFETLKENRSFSDYQEYIKSNCFEKEQEQEPWTLVELFYQKFKIERDELSLTPKDKAKLIKALRDNPDDFNKVILKVTFSFFKEVNKSYKEVDVCQIFKITLKDLVALKIRDDGSFAV